MTFKQLQLTDALYNYILDHSLRETEQLTALREYTRSLPMAIMQISPEQGQFMQLLLKLMGAKRVIELGVFTGYSSLAMALALPEDGEIIACDVSEEWTNIAQHYWRQAGVAQKIKLHLAPATQTLQNLLDNNQQNSFDAAFIDADKDNYLEYYELCLQLIRPGGLIMIDNTLRDGGVIDEADTTLGTQVIRDLNTLIARDPRVDVSMLGISDGVSLVLKY